MRAPLLAGVVVMMAAGGVARAAPEYDTAEEAAARIVLAQNSLATLPEQFRVERNADGTFTVNGRDRVVVERTNERHVYRVKKNGWALGSTRAYSFSERRVLRALADLSHTAEEAWEVEIQGSRWTARGRGLGNHGVSVRGGIDGESRARGTARVTFDDGAPYGVTSATVRGTDRHEKQGIVDRTLTPAAAELAEARRAAVRAQRAARIREANRPQVTHTPQQGRRPERETVSVATYDLDGVLQEWNVDQVDRVDGQLRARRELLNQDDDKRRSFRARTFRPARKGDVGSKRTETTEVTVTEPDGHSTGKIHERFRKDGTVWLRFESGAELEHGDRYSTTSKKGFVLAYRTRGGREFGIASNRVETRLPTVYSSNKRVRRTTSLSPRSHSIEKGTLPGGRALRNAPVRRGR